MGWGEMHRRNVADHLASAVRAWRDDRSTGNEEAVCKALQVYDDETAAERARPAETGRRAGW